MEQVNRNEEQTFVPTLEDWFRKYRDRRTGMIMPKGSLTVYAEDLGVPKEVLKQEEDWYNDGQLKSMDMYRIFIGWMNGHTVFMQRTDHTKFVKMSL